MLGFHASAAGHAAHAFEEFGHLGVLAEEVVDLADDGARGGDGDAFAAAAVDDGGVVALLGGRWVDDGLGAGELGLV